MTAFSLILSKCWHLKVFTTFDRLKCYVARTFSSSLIIVCFSFFPPVVKILHLIQTL